MVTVKAPPGTMDIVGTGGDPHGTLNVSTAVAFTVAGCGVPVAKHGNRASSSRSGSSDVLAALGINLDADFEVLEQCLAETGCVFLHAPRHHPTMRHVAEVRKKLGVRTIFNLLGPLTNPANVTRHLIGVYDLEWLGPMAETLKTLGSEAAWLAHGHDGMDEITTTAPTDIVELRRGMMRHFTLEPAHVGLPLRGWRSLRAATRRERGGDTRVFARREKSLPRYCSVQRRGGAYRRREGRRFTPSMTLAAQSVGGGGALNVLEKLVSLTNSRVKTA